MANHICDYKNKGKSADISREFRHAQMIEYRKEKRKELMEENRSKNVIVDTNLLYYIFEGKKYITSFPVNYFPIPSGAGHECLSCLFYASINNILIGLCCNCVNYVYPSIRPYDRSIEFTSKFATNMLPSYLKENEKQIISQHYNIVSATQSVQTEQFDETDSFEYYENEAIKNTNKNGSSKYAHMFI